MIQKVINRFKGLEKTHGRTKAVGKFLWFCIWRQYIYLKQFESYLRHKLRFPYRLNMNQVEIEIITACNLNCMNCDRSSRQAPSSEYMSVEQIKKFIKESIEFKKRWKQLRILGGEPLLHPDIIEICELFLEYKKGYSPRTEIVLFTNGYGQRVADVIKMIPEGISIKNSKKESPLQHFSSYNIAPMDLKDFHEKNKKNYYKGCLVNEMCGIGLNRYGYYPCGAGASVDRVFGWDIGIKELPSVSERALRKQLELICGYCGHFKNWGRSSPEGGPIMVDKEEMSSSWEKAYRAYKEKRPDICLY